MIAFIVTPFTVSKQIDLASISIIVLYTCVSLITDFC